VDPATGVRDMEITKALFDHYGHMFCGIYVHITRDGAVSLGDACSEPQPETAPPSGEADQ